MVVEAAVATGASADPTAEVVDLVGSAAEIRAAVELPATGNSCKKISINL
jgi:hypothetical protein